MTEKDVPPKDQHRLLAGLPETFDQWLATERAPTEPCHDDFEGEDEPRSPESVK